MQASKIAYYVVTGLFLLGILPGAIGDIVQPEMVLEIVASLGIPPAMLLLIGIWKLLGIVAVARPRWGRVTEWAYAGFFFDLTGAMVVHAAAGDMAGVVPPGVLTVFLVASYLLRERFLSAKEG